MRVDHCRMQGEQLTAHELRDLVVPIPSREEGEWQHLAHSVLNLIYEGNRQAAASLIAMSLGEKEAKSFAKAVAREIRGNRAGRTMHRLNDPCLPGNIERALGIERVLDSAWLAALLAERGE